MNDKTKAFWNAYLDTIQDPLLNPTVTASIAGNETNADELLALYLNGKKTAGSSLVKSYELCQDPLPQVDDYWIILDKTHTPKCIVKTVRVEFYQFDQVPAEVAIAEGEGDLSLDCWYQGHINFFTPYLKNMGILDLNKETIVTEFFEVVFK